MSLYDEVQCIMNNGYICHGISNFPFSDLFASRASLRPPALVTLTRDAVRACGTDNAVLQMAVAGAMT